MFPKSGENWNRNARKTNLQRSRILSSIYGARTKKRMRTAVEERPEILPRTSLSPFNPLPAIGKSTDSRLQEKTKDSNFILFDITKNENHSIKVHEVLKPLTPLRLNGYRRKMSTESLDLKPQQLLRENTYDLLKPIFLSAPKVKKRDRSLPRRILTPMTPNEIVSDQTYSDSSPSDENRETRSCHEVNNNVLSKKDSAKTRFRKAAEKVGKLSSVPETGKLLCLREKLKFNVDNEEVAPTGQETFRVASPTQRLSKLSEIFQNLEVKGRHRDKMKKENNWF